MVRSLFQYSNPERKGLVKGGSSNAEKWVDLRDISEQVLSTDLKEVRGLDSGCLSMLLREINQWQQQEKGGCD